MILMVDSICTKIPSKARGDFAFILYELASLKSTGKVALIVPYGILVRGAADRKIRSILLKDDVIESIVALPSNLFVGTGLQVALLILNKNKPDEKKGKVQFINAVQVAIRIKGFRAIA